MHSTDIPTQPIPLRRQGDTIWNILTLVVLIATTCVVIFFTLIYVNPHLAFNPFPPPTHTPTPPIPTATKFSFPPTWTPTAQTINASVENLSTPIPEGNFTPTPVLIATQLPTVESPVSGVSVETTDYPFGHKNEPDYVASTLIKSESGCNWLGVAGQALDLQGLPILGLLVNVGGSLQGVPVSLTGLTGTVTIYGDGGYELQLANQAVDTTDEIWIQLADQSNMPISERFYFDTYADCGKNLILVNFKQVK